MQANQTYVEVSSIWIDVLERDEKKNREIPQRRKTSIPNHRTGSSTSESSIAEISLDQSSFSLAHSIHSIHVCIENYPLAFLLRPPVSKT
jgi:hypothetical protein